MTTRNHDGDPRREDVHDIHMDTVEEIFGKRPPATDEEVRALRSVAKTINFDLLYGSGAVEALRKRFKS